MANEAQKAAHEAMQAAVLAYWDTLEKRTALDFADRTEEQEEEDNVMDVYALLDGALVQVAFAEPHGDAIRLWGYTSQGDEIVLAYVEPDHEIGTQTA